MRRHLTKVERCCHVKEIQVSSCFLKTKLLSFFTFSLRVKSCEHWILNTPVISEKCLGRAPARSDQNVRQQRVWAVGWLRAVQSPWLEGGDPDREGLLGKVWPVTVCRHLSHVVSTLVLHWDLLDWATWPGTSKTDPRTWRYLSIWSTPGY